MRSFYVALLLFTCGASIALADEWKFLSDLELAASPIIVEAVWEKTPFELHHKFSPLDRWRLLPVATEQYTKLRVIRTIKGPKVPPGEHLLMVAPGICWDTEREHRHQKQYGDWRFGDANDITKPSLWLLHRQKSRDPARPGEHLAFRTFREVQNLDLEALYLALGTAEPDKAVLELLKKPLRPFQRNDRVLEYLVGGDASWPYDHATRHGYGPKRGTAFPQHAERVWEYFLSRPDKEFEGSRDADYDKMMALAAYADLAGAKAVERLRPLLSHKTPDIRALAAALLARARDPSFEKQAAALKDGRGGSFGSTLLDEYAAWGDRRVIPCLLTFLQNDDTYIFAMDPGIPALRAREILHQYTGCWFPFDVAEAQRIWSEVATVADEQEQRKQLAKLLPKGECPLQAVIHGERLPPADPERVELFPLYSINVEVQNVSQQSITLLKKPSRFDVQTGAYFTDGILGGGWGSSPPQAFVTLQPNEKITFPIDINQNFTVTNFPKLSLRLGFFELPPDKKSKGWIGVMTAKAPEQAGKGSK